MASENIGLWVRLVAKEGKESAVEEFLASGAALVAEEPLTLSWYAIKIDARTFGIFDTFEAEDGRDAHLGGSVAAALMKHAADLLSEPPSIEKIDLIASKKS